jgi:hypothetical protein
MSQLSLSPLLGKIPGGRLEGVTVALVIDEPSGEEMEKIATELQWLYIDNTLGDRARFPTLKELVVFVTVDISELSRAREKIVELVTGVLPGLVASRRLCIKVYVRQSLSLHWLVQFSADEIFDL